jgi:4-amino-4-deoxy-L-arabinose transferase-like glycosyltransferase
MTQVQAISDQTARPRDGRRAFVILMALMAGTAGLSLLNAQRMPFMDPDEGRCVLIARDMLARGDWLAPHTPLLANTYFDKPIFYFWLLAGSFSLLGVTEFAARLVSAIGAALMVGATYQLGRVLLTPRAALWSAVLLATTALTTIAGRFVRMDIWLTALVAWGVFGWARVYFAGASRWSLVGGYVCLAAACLTKGPVGVLLPAAAVGAYLVVRRRPDWKALRSSRLLSGLGVIVLLAGPWFVYMSWRFPGYATDFFYRHHVLRATSATFGRSANLLLLPGIVVGGFLPWTVLLVGAILQAVRQRHNRDWLAGRPGLGLACWWAILGVVPFMIFHTKLPVYIMPAFPALALLAGDYVADLLNRNARREMSRAMGLTLAVMGLTLVALALTNRLTFDAAPWLTLARRLPVFAGLVLLTVWLLKTARLRGVLVVATTLTAVLTIDATWVEGPGLAEEFSSRRFAAPIERYQAGVDRLVVGPDAHYAVFCYLRRPPPVDYLEHKRDFAAYTGWDHPLLALLSSKSILRMAQTRFADRLTVLDEAHGAWLLQLRAADGATALEQCSQQAVRTANSGVPKTSGTDPRPCGATGRKPVPLRSAMWGLMTPSSSVPSALTSPVRTQPGQGLCSQRVLPNINSSKTAAQ